MITKIEITCPHCGESYGKRVITKRQFENFLKKHGALEGFRANIAESWKNYPKVLVYSIQGGHVGFHPGLFSFACAPEGSKFWLNILKEYKEWSKK